MIKLSEEEKRFIKALDHPTYTAEWVEEWINCNDNVFVNAIAALQAMGAKGFYEAVRSMICMPEYEKLKERDRAMKPKQSGATDSKGIFHPINGIGGVPYDLCPNCNHVLRDDRKCLRFCEYCGQRIDWSEEES